MYYKTNTMPNKPNKVVTTITCYEVQLLNDHKLEVTVMFLQFWIQSKKWNWKQIRQSQKTHYSGCEGIGSSLEHEKHLSHHANWWDFQKCYSWHKVGHIAQYCPSTGVAECTALIESVPATITISIDNYRMTVMNGESPSQESWYLGCATTTLIYGDQQMFECYMEYAKWE